MTRGPTAADRGDAVERNTIDARGARIAIRMYLRWMWVPLVAVVVGYMVGGMLSRSEPSSVRTDATFTIGLTEEVRWPFFDAVRARGIPTVLISNWDHARAGQAMLEATGLAERLDHVGLSPIAQFIH